MDIVADVIIIFLTVFLIKYFEEKGKNEATKQDARIIKYLEEKGKNEATKQDAADIQKSIETEKQKRELKYKALMKSQCLIDAYLSHRLTSEGKPIKKQFFKIEDARKCFDELIATVDYVNTLNTFIEILSYDKETTAILIELVNKYRNLVRKELGFGGEIKLSEEKAFIAQVICDPDVIQENNKK